MKKQKYKPLNEFRYNKHTKHMNYVFGTNGKKSKSIGLTTEEKTFGLKNMPLKHNTKNRKNEQSYVRNGFITEKINMFSHKSNSYAFHKEDFPNVKAKIINYKRNNKNLW